MKSFKPVDTIRGYTSQTIPLTPQHRGTGIERDPMLRDLLNQLTQINLGLVQILAPIIALEYGADTADQLISALGEQLRGILQQLESLQGGTAVRVLPGKVHLKRRRRA